MNTHFSRGVKIARSLQGEALGALVTNFHRHEADAIREGRNVIAGYMRAWGIEYGALSSWIKQDPVFQESWRLASPMTIVHEFNLMNIFLIMKYGMKGIHGDFIEFGSYRGGSALFIASVAKHLGFTGRIYALDTFQGMPPTDSLMDYHQQGDFSDVSFEELVALGREKELDNLFFIKGLFEETLPELLGKIECIALAHIDCDIYSAVKYAITSVRSLMHSGGGYLVLDDPLFPACLGSLQAVEEELQSQGFRAEQTYPHLVYRVPKI